MLRENLSGMPSEEEWAGWLDHPCTKRLRYWATKGRQDLMERWADGGFSAAFTLEMAVKNAGATGACSIYADVDNLDYQQIVIGASDEDTQQIGSQPIGPSGPGRAV